MEEEKMDSNKSHRSALWHHFEKAGDSSVCKKCKRAIRSCGNTTNLRNHLKTKHPLLFAQFQKTKQMQASTSTSESSDLTAEYSEEHMVISLSPSAIQYSDEEKNPTVEQVSSPAIISPKTSQTTMRSFTLTKAIQSRTDRYLAYFVSTEMMPYNIVEKNGFRKFVEVLNGSYKLPNRKSLAEKLIPDLYNQTRHEIETYLKQATFTSFTTDCWTSVASKSYIAVTCHFINESFDLVSICLGCYEMNEDHTAENLQNHIGLILNEWNLENENMHAAFTTDYGSNIVKAVRDMGKIHVCCFGHAINIAANRCFENETLKESLEKVKKIQGIFAHSWKAFRDFKLIQEKYNSENNLKNTKIPSYSKTRWWSLLNLIKVVIEQELSLLNFLQTFKNGFYRRLILTSDDLKFLKITVEMLDPIQNISDSLSGESYVTGSTIIPISLELGKTLIDEYDETQIDEEIVSLKKEIGVTILNVLKDRYEGNTETNRILKTASFIDPRFKTSFFKKSEIESIIEQIVQLEYVIKIEENVMTQRVGTPKHGRLSSIFKSFKTSEDDQQATTGMRIKNEINQYINVPKINVDEDPLLWWKQNSKTFPVLSQCAKKFLSVPASSVPSERIFSRGGQIVTDLRSSLTGDHIEQLVFLTMNKKYVKF